MNRDLPPNLLWNLQQPESPQDQHTKSLRLSESELRELTGYATARKQLEFLHQRGFYRATLGRFGRVVLERAHFEAVCQGRSGLNDAKPRPELILPQRSSTPTRKARTKS